MPKEIIITINIRGVPPKDLREELFRVLIMTRMLPMQTVVRPRGGHLSHKRVPNFSHRVSKLAEGRLVDNLRNHERESEWPRVEINQISLRPPIISKIRAQQSSR